MTAALYKTELAMADSTSLASPSTIATTGGITVLLRLEGAAELAAALVVYQAIGGNWWLFAGLFLLPDLSMLGYLARPTLGAVLYNAGHTFLAPGALTLVGWSQGMPGLISLAIIWAAHIGFDRMLGFGLKLGTAFGATHLGWRG